MCKSAAVTVMHHLINDICNVDLCAYQGVTHRRGATADRSDTYAVARQAMLVQVANVHCVRPHNDTTRHVSKLSEGFGQVIAWLAVIQQEADSLAERPCPPQPRAGIVLAQKAYCIPRKKRSQGSWAMESVEPQYTMRQLLWFACMSSRVMLLPSLRLSSEISLAGNLLPKSALMYPHECCNLQ